MAPGAGFPPPLATERVADRRWTQRLRRGARPIASTRFAVVDVETSGLRPDRHRLLQIGVVRVLGDGTVIDRWDTLLRAPWRPLGGRDIHGLSRRTLRGAPRLRQVAGRAGRPRSTGSIVCAHNAEFDWSFLVRGLRRAGLAAAGRAAPLHPAAVALARPGARALATAWATSACATRSRSPGPTTPRPTPRPPPRSCPSSWPRPASPTWRSWLAYLAGTTTGVAGAGRRQR